MSAPIRLHDHLHPEDHYALMGEVKRTLDSGKALSEQLQRSQNGLFPPQIAETEQAAAYWKFGSTIRMQAIMNLS